MLDVVPWRNDTLDIFAYLPCKKWLNVKDNHNILIALTASGVSREDFDFRELNVCKSLTHKFVTTEYVQIYLDQTESTALRANVKIFSCRLWTR